VEEEGIELASERQPCQRPLCPLSLVFTKPFGGEFVVVSVSAFCYFALVWFGFCF
jgi:hypothetical protein